MQIEIEQNPLYVITLDGTETDALLAFLQAHRDTWGMHNTAYCVRELYDTLRKQRDLT